MSATTADPVRPRCRLAATIAIAVLSILLPSGLVAWTVTSVLEGKIWGRPSNVFRLFQMGVKSGEMWFSETRLTTNPAVPNGIIDSRIKRLNLQTGVEKDTGLVVPDDVGAIHTIDEKLYVFTQTKIYEAVGNSLVELASLPPRSATFHSSIFLGEDNRLTLVRQMGDGDYRLIHLVDGQWKQGRPILLPEMDRVWHDDLQRGRRVVLPRTSQQPVVTLATFASTSLQVVKHGQQYHLMCSVDGSFTGYRLGFEFADDEKDDGTSALAPENGPREISGWESIGTPSPNGDRWMEMTSYADGLLFVAWNWPSRVIRRTPDGVFEDLTILGEKDARVMWAFGDPFESTAWYVNEDQRWGSAEIGRIEGKTVHPVELKVPGQEREYIGRWLRLLTSVLIAWLLHIGVLVAGAQWLTRTHMATFEFGVQQALLSPVWRRALATAIDLILLGLAAGLFGLFLFSTVPLDRGPTTDRELAQWLMDLESNSFSGSPLGAFRRVLGSPAGPGFEVFGIWMVALLVMCLAKVYLEGRYGLTPGKWLLSLRTVRSTLRPCGIARAVVRNVLYCVDIPFLLTPLPGLLSLILSEHRQTLGDRAAGTLIIRAGSIADAKTSSLPQAFQSE